MRVNSLLRSILDMKHTRVLGARFGPDALQIQVAPATRIPRCAGCGCKVRRIYDRREKSWRHLDFGGMETTLHYDLRRVDCRRCRRVVSEMVPWADRDARFTRDFEDHVAYLAQRTDQTSVSTTMRVAWRTVGSIVARVVERCRDGDLLDGLEFIGVDELSYRRHHEYVTVVVDHVRQRIVWVAEGKNSATLDDFFNALGPERTAKLKIVTADMSRAFISSIRARAPKAELVFDRFHVQRLVQDALDQVRRAEVRALEGTGQAGAIKNTRWALLKNYWNVSTVDGERLHTVQRKNKTLYRAYLMKSAFVDILGNSNKYTVRKKLNDWIAWARRSRLKPFKKVAATIRTYVDGIVAIVTTGFSNGRTEGLNGKTRTITRRAFGFHSAKALCAMIMLCCSGIVLHPIFKSPPVHP